jgi:hypothetical protein
VCALRSGDDMQPTALTADTFSRISKLHVDAEELSPEEAGRRRAQHRMTLVLGPEIASSATLQAAALTAAVTALRCFPGAVRFSSASNPSLRVAWGEQLGICDALIAVGVTQVECKAPDNGSTISFGSTSESGQGLQVTFDRWIGAVVPMPDRFRLREREGCILAGVLAGSLAVGEEFFRFAALHPEAGLRQVGSSLWNPLQDWRADNVNGPVLDYLPTEFSVLGLGHLGQAYSWTLGLLPFSQPEAVTVMLTDFDRVVPANYETGVLSVAGDDGKLKTRIVMRWLEARRFKTRIVERAFDEGMRRQAGEPPLALAGFDGAGPRWALDQVELGHVIDGGLGGNANNFDVIGLHTLPHPDFSAEALWPRSDGIAAQERASKLASSNRVYEEVRRRHGCGQLELASRAVAVPFVGMTAASYALAEAARAVLGGIRVGNANVRISSLSQATFREIPDGYSPSRAPAIRYQRAVLPLDG